MHLLDHFASIGKKPFGIGDLSGHFVHVELRNPHGQHVNLQKV